MEIRIRVRTVDPLTGTAEAKDGEPLTFAGWVELLRAISTLLGGRGASGTPQEAAERSATGTQEEDAE